MHSIADYAKVTVDRCKRPKGIVSHVWRLLANHSGEVRDEDDQVFILETRLESLRVEYDRMRYAGSSRVGCADLINSFERSDAGGERQRDLDLQATVYSAVCIVLEHEYKARWTTLQAHDMHDLLVRSVRSLMAFGLYRHAGLLAMRCRSPLFERERDDDVRLYSARVSHMVATGGVSRRWLFLLWLVSGFGLYPWRMFGWMCVCAIGFAVMYAAHPQVSVQDAILISSGLAVGRSNLIDVPSELVVIVVFQHAIFFAATTVFVVLLTRKLFRL